MHIREYAVIKYTTFLNKIRFAILLFFLIAFGGSIYPASQLSRSVAPSMAPPSSSPSAIAFRDFQQRFPQQADATPIVIYLTANDHHSIIRSEFLTFDMLLGFSLEQYPSGGMLMYSSYGTLKTLGFPEAVYEQYVSTDNLSAMIAVAFKYNSDDSRTLAFVSFVKESITKHESMLGGKIDVYVLGVNTFQESIDDAATDDLLRLAAVVLPICCVVFCYQMACIRFLIVPVVSMACSVIFSFAILYGVTKTSLSVSSVVPGIVLFLNLSVVSNYSIFIMEAYRSEAKQRLRIRTSLTVDNKVTVVRKVMVSAGLNIMYSGATLGLCGGGLIAFPLDTLRSIGCGCLVSVVMAMVTTLVLVPTMLLTFYQFFSRGVRETCQENMKVFDYCVCQDHDSDEKEVLSPTSVPVVDVKRKPFFKISVFVTTMPFNLIITFLVLGLCIYPMTQSVTINYTNAVTLFLPRGGDQMKGWNGLVSAFNPGEVYTYRMLFILKDPNSNLFYPPNWMSLQGILKDLYTNVPNTACHNLASVVLNGVEDCTFISELDIYNASVMCNATNLPKGYCKGDTMYQALLAKTFVPDDMKSTWALIKLDINPTSLDGHRWYSDVQDRMTHYSDTSPFKVELSGSAAESIDVISFVHAYFPIMAALTFAVLLVVLSLAYYSLVTPLRCVVNVVITILTVWGGANLVYLHGILNYFQIDGLKTTGSVAWMAPFAALMICVRLCLDFDLVFFRKVSELYFKGRTVREAIRYGMTELGPCITSCGIIMALSFSGLVFSRMPVMNQLGFYLVSTALLETVVMRIFFVPAVLSLLGEWNWLPRSLVAKKFLQSRESALGQDTLVQAGDDETPWQ